MPTAQIRIIRFEYLDNLEIELRPASPMLNAVFAAFAEFHLRPLEISSMLPDDHPRALTEERALDALRKVFAAAVTVGSPTHEEFDGYQPREWYEWLLGHPDEFKSIQELAHEDNYLDTAETPG